MTKDEQNLLLAVARLLRAHLRDDIASPVSDLEAINDALAPFDPSPVHDGDFESQASD